MSLPDNKNLDIALDGVPFVRQDLTGKSLGLDIVLDGVPWIGYVSTAPPEPPTAKIPIFYYAISVLDAL